MTQSAMTYTIERFSPTEVVIDLYMENAKPIAEIYLSVGEGGLSVHVIPAVDQEVDCSVERMLRFHGEPTEEIADTVAAI